MSNSRMRLSNRADDDKPHNSSKGKGIILETPYKPGFVDDKDLETVKMAVDKELSDISNAFYQTTERTADTITRVDKLEISGETQYGELVAKIETVDKVSKEGDVALAERITTFEASTNNQFGEVNAAITETNRVMAAEDKILAEKIDSIVGSFEGELGPLFAQIDEVRQLSIDGDKAIGTRIDSIEVKFEQADKDLAANIKTEEEARVEQDLALAKRIDTLSATITTEDSKLSAAITTEQTARVDADKALATSISKVEADYKAADVATNAAITNESIARSDADKALASNITKVEADYKAADDQVAKDSSALVQTEASARADGDSALAGQILTVKSELDGDIASVRQFATTEVNTAKDAVAAEEAARLAAQAVLDGKITQEQADRLILEGALRGEIKANQDAISAEEAARLVAEAVLSGKITKEEADRLYMDGILKGEIDLNTGQIGAINAKWGVELDVNGKISGIVMNNNGARSNFEVRADLFRFTDTSGNSSGGFVSSGGITQFHGAVYAQAGIFDHVVINESCTYKGSITSNQIQDTAVTAVAKASNNVNNSGGVGTSDLASAMSTATINIARPYDRTVMFTYPGEIGFSGSKGGSGSKRIICRIQMYYNGGLISDVVFVDGSTTNNTFTKQVYGSIVGRIPANTTGTLQVNAAFHFQDSTGMSIYAPSLVSQWSIFKVSSEIS